MIGADWSAWTWFALAVGCFALLPIPNIYDHRKAILARLGLSRLAAGRPEGRKKARSWTAGDVFGYGAVILIGFWLGTSYFRDREPEVEWVHPTLSTQDQRKEIAECQMKTLEGPPHRAYTRHYMDACLTSKGFAQVRVADDG